MSTTSFGLRMLLLVCGVLPLLTNTAEAAAVMAVDLGAEWIKVGIVSPGVPMEIVLNKESKRKSPAVVAFRDGVRTFGEDAINVGVRFPKNSYKYLLDLLGKPFNHTIVKEYRQRFPYYDMKACELTGRALFVHDENTVFSVEELVAQLLGKAKEIAEIGAGQQIVEAVIIVPGFFNQAERRAVVEAATLAGLKVLQLINDYTAIAINYGIFRRKDINETASYTVFFDMGALSTKAALVEYKLIKTKEKGYLETIPQLQVLGVAYDRTLGGLEMTLRLREHLIGGWLRQGGADLRSNARAMEKLLKEAERLKVILSANTDYYAQIEGLYEDKDFRMKVSRDELETLCAEMFSRAAGVVGRALAAAGGAGAGALGVVAGGAARSPKLQQALRDALGHEPSRGINADEAATMGAAYRAASLAKGYKVAPLQVKDAVILPIQVTFMRQVDGQEKLVKRILFGPMNPYPQKKVITFNKHISDFGFSVNYAELDHLPSVEVERVGSLNLTRVFLKGVAAALAKHTGDNVEHKGVKAHFSMDDSGILNLVNVEFVAEKTVTDDDDSTLSKIGSTISKLFSSDENNIGEDKPQEKTDNDTAKNVTDKTTENLNVTESKDIKPKVVVLKEPIQSEEEIIGVQPIPIETLEKYKAKIKELDIIDMNRSQRERALNQLESFVIDMQLKMGMEEYIKCGTPEEVEKIKAMCSQISEWLYEDGYDATTELYETKLSELQSHAHPLLYRCFEHKERPEAIDAMQNMLNSTHHFLEAAKNNTKEANPEQDIFTEVEIKVLEDKIISTETWLEQAIKEQNALKKHEPMKLTIAAIKEKMGELDREVKYLLNKLKIWRPKKPAKVEKETNTTEEKKSETADNVIEEPQVEIDAEIPESISEVPELEVKEEEEEEAKDEHSEL